ncbi:hypothetical protein [Methanosphaera sp.]
MNINKENKKLLLIPAILSFIIASILVYKFTYPISWDVYYHIHMADLYMRQGLVFWDYETVAPTGRLIMYPPLFHILLGLFSKLSGLSLINLTRILQPLFSFLLIFVITYCGYKFSDNIITGVCTGFLGMFSFVTFNRSVICTPATIAIALSMLACLFFYQGIQYNNYSKILLSAILLGLICNLHMATSLMTMGVLGLYGLIQLCRSKFKIKHVLLFILVVSVVSLPWWTYVYMKYTLVFNSISGNSLLLTDFIFKYYGIICFVFTLLGFYKLLKEKEDKSLFLTVWALSLVLLSQITYLGVETVSIRILEVASYPLIIIAGIGFVYFINSLKSYKLKRVLIIILVVISICSTIMYVDSYTPDLLDEEDYNTTLFSQKIHVSIDPIGTILKPTIISSRFGNSQLAHDRQDIMTWFMKNSNNSFVVSEDSIMDTIIVCSSNSSVVYGGFTESIPGYVVDPVHIIENHSTSYELSDLGIDYILLRQNTTTPSYVQVEYTNQNYKICSIKI